MGEPQCIMKRGPPTSSCCRSSRDSMLNDGISTRYVRKWKSIIQYAPLMIFKLFLFGHGMIGQSVPISESMLQQNDGRRLGGGDVTCYLARILAAENLCKWWCCKASWVDRWTCVLPKWTGWIEKKAFGSRLLDYVRYSPREARKFYQPTSATGLLCQIQIRKASEKKGCPKAACVHCRACRRGHQILATRHDSGVTLGTFFPVGRGHSRATPLFLGRLQL